MLEDAPTLDSPPLLIIQSTISTARKAMKSDKSPGPSVIFVEMFKAGHSNIEDRITTLTNVIVHQKHIP